MSDNFITNTASGGETFRSLEQAGGVLWPLSVIAFATTVSDGANVCTVPTASALAANMANPTTITFGSCLLAFDGTTWDPVTNGGGTEATALRVTIASDSTGVLSVDDNGGSLTVDGTVAATQSGTWNVTNVSGTVSLPTGASTLAEQQSQTTALQLIDNLVLAEDAAHISGDVGVQALAVRKDSGATIAGTDGDYTPLQVDSSGNLRVNVAAGSSTTQYTEDAAAAADPVGTAIILVRQDTLSTTTVSLDGDNIAARGSSTGAQYVEITNGTTKIAAGGGTEATALRVTVASDSTGVLSVDDNGSSLTIDNNGTFAIQDSQVGTDNNAFAQGSAKVWPVSFVFDEVAGGGLSEDSQGIARINANRSQILVIEDGSTRTRYATVTASNALKVDGSAVTQPVSLASGATAIAKAEDVASADADVGVGMLAVRKATPANTSGTDGDYEFLQISAGRLWASATIDAALPAGTNAIGKLAANTGVDIGDVDVTSVVPGTTASSLGKAEDGAHTTGDVGVMSLAVRTDTPTDRSGTDGDYEPLQTAGGRLHVNGPVAHRTDAIFNNNTSITPAFVPIDAGTSGNNTVVSAQASKKIRVVALHQASSGTVGAQWQSGASGTKLTGRQRWTAQTGVSLPFNPTGWYETASGQLLNLHLDAAVGVYGSLTYIAV